MIEKLRLGVRNTLALYSESNLTGPTSFVFGITTQKDNSTEKILGSWFCSSIFLAIYIVKRRIIHGEFGRVTAGDLMVFPCLNPQNLDKMEIEGICTAFDNYRFNQPYKSMINQIRDRNPYLLELDKKILNALNLEKAVLESTNYKTIDDIQERIYSSIIQWAEQFFKK